jgi:hypothetical protein
MKYEIYSEAFALYVSQVILRDNHGYRAIGICGGKHPVKNKRQSYDKNDLIEIASVLNQINATGKTPKSIWYNDDCAMSEGFCISVLNDARCTLTAVLSGGDVAIIKGRDIVCHYNVTYGGDEDA